MVGLQWKILYLGRQSNNIFDSLLRRCQEKRNFNPLCSLLMSCRLCTPLGWTTDPQFIATYDPLLATAIETTEAKENWISECGAPAHGDSISHKGAWAVEWQFPVYVPFYLG